MTPTISAKKASSKTGRQTNNSLSSITGNIYIESTASKAAKAAKAAKSAVTNATDNNKPIDVENVKLVSKNSESKGTTSIASSNSSTTSSVCGSSTSKKPVMTNDNNQKIKTNATGM